MWECMSRVTISPQAVNKSGSNEYDDEYDVNDDGDADEDDNGNDDDDYYLQLSMIKFAY